MGSRRPWRSPEGEVAPNVSPRPSYDADIYVDDRYALTVTHKAQTIDRDAVNSVAPSHIQNMRFALEVPNLVPPSPIRANTIS